MVCFPLLNLPTPFLFLGTFYTGLSKSISFLHLTISICGYWGDLTCPQFLACLPFFGPIPRIILRNIDTVSSYYPTTSSSSPSLLFSPSLIHLFDPLEQTYSSDSSIYLFSLIYHLFYSPPPFFSFFSSSSLLFALFHSPFFPLPNTTHQFSFRLFHFFNFFCFTCVHSPSPIPPFFSISTFLNSSILSLFFR